MKPFNYRVNKFIIGLLFLAASFLQIKAQTIIDQNEGNLSYTTKQLTVDLPAFPGAEGFGAFTSGGRGGQIIYVTNLNNAGTGSLREACEASGARTVIFHVAGTIELSSVLNIKNPYITIAGQTAPGDGICLKLDQTKPHGGALFQVSTSEVIIRFIRLRRGPGVDDECCGDPIAIGNSVKAITNIIIDHCSISWSTDELLNTWYDVSNFTVQNCIMSESLNNSMQNVEHGKGPFFGDGSHSITAYRNYICHNHDRNGYYVFDRPGQTALFEHINNVTYNWAYFGNNYESRWDGIVNANVIGNFMIPGPDTRTNRYEIGVGEHETPAFTTKIYVSNNIGPHRSSLSETEWDIVGYNVNFTLPAPTDYQSDTPFNTPMANSTLLPQDAYDYVIVKSGAFARVDENGEWIYNRDATDTRVINDMLTGGPTDVRASGYYGLIDHPDEVGGWETYDSGIGYRDLDYDGMPDSWETKNGLDPNDPSDAIGTELSSEGYTNIEMFINITDASAFKQYLLTTNVVGSGSISPESRSYDNGTAVSMTATPDEGWSFSGWSGALSGTTNPQSLTMDSNWDVTANFTQDNVGISNQDGSNDLIHNYPNPLSSETRFEYRIPGQSNVKLSVFNISGQTVVVLVNQDQLAGSYEILWDGTSASGTMLKNGVYFYQFRIDSEIFTKKIIIEK